jgi:DNA-binding YbaB/EbfC family protein
VSSSDLGRLMEQAQQMRARIEELQRELASRRFEASSGGGMVTAVASGALRILEVRIEPTLVASGDREMLQDLVATAVNAALETAQAAVQQELQRASGLPGPFGS